MTSVALNNLWTYLQGLSLSQKDRNWLAGKLAMPANDAKKEDQTLVSKEEFIASLERGEEEYRQGKCVRLLQGESVSEMLRRSGL